MGNRAYLSVYLKGEHFSKELMEYKKKVDVFYEDWFDLSEKEQNSRNNDLMDLSMKVFDIDDYYITSILPNLDTQIVDKTIYYCNTYPFGEYSDSSLSIKNKVPLEWCLLFDIKDKIDETSYLFKGTETIFKANQFRTTVDKALERLNYKSSNSNLIKFLGKYPNDAIVILHYGELFMNDDFNELDLINTIKTGGICDLSNLSFAH